MAPCVASQPAGRRIVAAVLAPEALHGSPGVDRVVVHREVAESSPLTYGSPLEGEQKLHRRGRRTLTFRCLLVNAVTSDTGASIESRRTSDSTLLGTSTMS
jgi:hypothetical protein